MRTLWTILVAIVAGFVAQAQQQVNNFRVLTNLYVGNAITGLTLNGYNIDAIATNSAAGKLDATNGTAVNLSAAGLSLRPAWTAPATNLWTFGDSQTAGSNGAVTNYTSGGSLIASNRWPNLFAAVNSLNLTNLGKGGSGHGYATGSDILRQTPINRFGANMPADWSGVATLMIGYNHIALANQMPDFDTYYLAAQEAWIARALLDGWAGVGTAGTTYAGGTWASWSTDGSQTLSGNTDDTVFPIGNPGTDQRTRLVLTGSQGFALTLTNKPVAAIFADAHVDGGLLYVWTNGVFAGQLDTAFAGRWSGGATAFPMVLWIDGLSGNTTITATNMTGTNYVLAAGWLDSTSVTDRTIIVGSPVRSYVFGKPWGPEMRMAGATLRAVGKFSSFPVYYADVNGRFGDPAQNFDEQDRDHLNPFGNKVVAAAFQTPIKPLNKHDYAQAELIGGLGYTAKANGTNLTAISKLLSRRLVVGDAELDNTEKAIIAVATTNNVVGELGFFQDSLEDAGQKWGIRLNTTTSPLLRFVKFSGGSAAGSALDIDYSTLGVTHNFTTTNVGKATFTGDIYQTAAAPSVIFDSTGVKSLLWQTNGVSTFKLEAQTSDSLLRFVVTDVSGTAAGVPMQIYRSGQVRFPLAVTNESTTSLQGAATVGLSSGIGRLTIQSGASLENRIIWASGSTATNRAHAGMVTHDIWRLTALNTAGTSTLFVPLQVDVAAGNVTSGGTRYTNTAISTFTSITPPLLKNGVTLDSDSTASGALFLNSTNITHWRLQEAAGVLGLTRFTDAGVAVENVLESDRATGAVRFKNTTAALTYSGTNVTHAPASTISGATLTLTNNCLLTITSSDGASGGITIVPDSSTSYTVYLASGIKLLGGGSSFVVTNSASETVNLEWKQTLRGGSSVILANKAVYP